MSTPPVNGSERLELVFDRATVRDLQGKFAHLPPWARPAVAAAALDVEMSGRRAWIDDRVAQLNEQQQKEFIARLRSPEQHVQTLVELTLGSLLSDAGCTVEHDPLVGGLTPDLSATDPSGRRCLLEVWTRSIPPATTIAQRQWGALAHRLSKVRIPVQIAVDSAERSVTEPPNPAEVAAIVQALARWLKSGEYRTGGVRTVAGFAFGVRGPSDGGGVEVLPVVPATTADSRNVWDAVNDKATKYRSAVNSSELPFVVVLSAEPRAGLDRELVAGALAGRNSMTMNFDLRTFGPMEFRPVEMRASEAPPTFDPCVAGVGWTDVSPEGDPELTVWRTSTAAHPLPDLPHRSIHVLDRP